VVGDSGSRCFCRRVLITLVTPNPAVHMRPLQSASIGNKRDRRCWPIQKRAWSLPYPASGSSQRQSHPCRTLRLHFELTHAPRRLRPGRCPPFCMPIRPRCRPIVQWRPMGGGDSPARRPGAIALSRSRSPCSPLPWPFCGVYGAPPPTVSIDRWGAGVGGEQRRWPAGDPPFAPPPAIQLRSRQ